MRARSGDQETGGAGATRGARMADEARWMRRLGPDVLRSARMEEEKEAAAHPARRRRQAAGPCARGGDDDMRGAEPLPLQPSRSSA
jgi:hypothetical protein